MRNIFLLLSTILVFVSCDKDNNNPEPTNPVDQLPPATQVGANKVGCLLDGVVFLPDNSPNSTNCFYQFVDGNFYFYLNLNNFKNNVFKSVSVGTEKLEIHENQTLNLLERNDGNAYGLYILNITDNYTNQIQTGQLKITRLTNQIVSGTFSFDIKDAEGDIHQIREGRFDMQYTN